MSRQFLIAGLPRCRTAWLSVATTTAQSFCHHEPVPDLDRFEALQALWRPLIGHAVGVSDSCLSLQLERILETVAPRVLLVERPIEDILASFRRYLDGTEQVFDYEVGREYLLELQAQIDRFRGHPMVRTMAFAALEDYAQVQEILTWLVPDTEFPDLRSLMRMNIQVDRAYCLKRANQPHNGWHHRQWSTSPKSDPA